MGVEYAATIHERQDRETPVITTEQGTRFAAASIGVALAISYLGDGMKPLPRPGIRTTPIPAGRPSTRSDSSLRPQRGKQVRLRTVAGLARRSFRGCLDVVREPPAKPRAKARSKPPADAPVVTWGVVWRIGR